MKMFLPVLIILICLTKGVSGQSSPTPQTLPDCGYTCVNIERLGRNNHLIIYQHPIIYEFDTQTNNITETSVSSYFRGLRGVGDFAVLENNRILFTEHIGDVEFKLLDMQTQQVVVPVHNLSGIISPCGRITGIGIYEPGYIFRYDNDRVLLCTKESNRAAYINLARLEGNNLVLEQRFRFGSYGEVPTYPTSWFTVLSGLDSKVYVVGRDAIIPVDYNMFTVRGYDLNSQAWLTTIVDIPTSRPDFVSSNRVRDIELIGVDETSNMYFLEQIRNESLAVIASSLIKFSSIGEKLWELTESELGGIFDNVIISGENQFFIFFSDNSFLHIELAP